MLDKDSSWIQLINARRAKWEYFVVQSMELFIGVCLLVPFRWPMALASSFGFGMDSSTLTSALCANRICRRFGRFMGCFGLLTEWPIRFDVNESWGSSVGLPLAFPEETDDRAWLSFQSVVYGKLS